MINPKTEQPPARSSASLKRAISTLVGNFLINAIPGHVCSRIADRLKRGSGCGDPEHHDPCGAESDGAPAPRLPAALVSNSGPRPMAKTPFHDPQTASPHTVVNG